MATKCPACNSTDTQALVNNNQCLNCGRLFDFDGNLTATGMDDATRDAIVSRTEPRTTNVVGNLADLQRLGAQKVSDSKESAFQPPPGVNADALDEGGIGVQTTDGEVEPAAKSRKAKSK